MQRLYTISHKSVKSDITRYNRIYHISTTNYIKTVLKESFRFIPDISGEGLFVMGNKQDPRERYQLRLSKQERETIQFIMERENISVMSKAIRFCVQERAKQIRQREKRLSNGI